MIDAQDSIFHKIYPFDEWVYSTWYQEWVKLAEEDRRYRKENKDRENDNNG